MARAKTKPQKQPLVIRSYTLTQDTDHVLQQLRQEASDVVGWTISGSAIVRALLQYAARQPSSWGVTMLFPLIEQEIKAGTLWGSKKK
jgi:hypothetical protein